MESPDGSLKFGGDTRLAETIVEKIKAATLMPAPAGRATRGAGIPD
jgi:hypothetical protein